MSTCGAEVLVNNLKAQGVTHIFGIPGAKVDRVFDALIDSGIQLVVCRHEQNASFIVMSLNMQKHLELRVFALIAQRKLPRH
ncbi:MAG: thiamine pyrophosphate-binding protein [Cyanobacteriota bacterium ELA615]